MYVCMYVSIHPSIQPASHPPIHPPSHPSVHPYIFAVQWSKVSPKLSQAFLVGEGFTVWVGRWVGGKTLRCSMRFPEGSSQSRSGACAQQLPVPKSRHSCPFAVSGGGRHRNLRRLAAEISAIFRPNSRLAQCGSES